MRQPTAEYVQESSRSTPILRHCDVLVVGGGAAGTAAAIAAARAGAEVALVERYNHLGGLASGGLALWIDRMTDWQGRLLTRGVAEELLNRIPPGECAGPPSAQWGGHDPQLVAHWQARAAAFHGVVTHSPTVSPEWLKWVSQDMLRQARVALLLHAWCVAPLMQDGAVRGAFFESKEGRFGIRAHVVVDATGDGDVLAWATDRFEADAPGEETQPGMNTAWLFGGVDMQRWIAFGQDDPKGYAEFVQGGRERMRLFECPQVAWRNDLALFTGPRQAGLSARDVEDLTTVERRSRDLMIAHLAWYRERAPGFEQAWLMQSAPQLGVRHSRRIVGLSRVQQSDWNEGAIRGDEIGVSPSPSPYIPSLSIPYGCLVPVALNGLLAPGRHVSCDLASHALLGATPQCWVTGQAAGAAAALAARDRIEPRAVHVKELQRLLIRQAAYLRATN